MGQAITASGGVGKMAANMLKSAGEEDPEREAELRERLSFLQRMAYTILDAKTNEILHSQEGDLKVKLGTIVDIHKRVEFEHSDSPKTFEAAVDSVMTDSLNGIFSDRVKSSIRGVVKTATDTFLSNDSVGEVKYEDIIVVWDNCALLLVDFFVWRYYFSTSNILQHVDAVYAYVIIKRVIDISKVSQELVTYSTSNDCTGENMKILNKIKEMQLRATSSATQPLPKEKIVTKMQHHHHQKRRRRKKKKKRRKKKRF